MRMAIYGNKKKLIKSFKIVLSLLLIIVQLLVFVARPVEAVTIQIKDLPLGSIVYDDSWMWEHKTGNNYTGSGEVKPVQWRVVSKNHI